MIEPSQIIPVDLVALVEDQESASPIVVLHDRVNNKLLPIWVGDPEARAIALALNNMSTSRPLTHSLMISVIEGMQGRLSRIVVDRIKNQTYYSTLYIETKTGIIKVDARPSDAIALALSAHIPIFVGKEVMDRAGQENPVPMLFEQPAAKKELSASELKKVRDLLDKAREREQSAGGDVK